jgi:hypothetical protein
MTEVQQNFSLYQGQDCTVQIPVLDEDDQPKPMTSGTPTFHMFYDPDADLADAVLSITGSAITIISIDDTDDGVQIVFAGSDTAGIAIGDYYFQVWVADNAGNDNPVTTGWVTIKPSPVKKT